MVQKIIESDCKETKPVNPKGNQLWIFVGKTDVEAEAPILWPCDVLSTHTPITSAPVALLQIKSQKERGQNAES